MPAPLFLAKGDLPQELLHRIRVFPYDPELLLTGVTIERIEPPFILGRGMDVRIVKVAADIMPFRSQHPQRIDGARRAADVQQYFLSHFQTGFSAKERTNPPVAKPAGRREPR
jgi:hypothetical protein